MPTIDNPVASKSLWLYIEEIGALGLRFTLIHIMQCPAPYEIRFLHCNSKAAHWFCRSRTAARGYWYCYKCGVELVQELPVFMNVPSLSNRPKCPIHKSCGVVIDGSKRTVRFACLQQMNEYEQPLEIKCELDVELDGWVVSRWLVTPVDATFQGSMTWTSYATQFHTEGSPLRQIARIVP